MSLREIHLEAPIFDTENKMIHIKEHDSLSAIKQNWESIDCRLVTPLHGGGVKARESDEAMPIRVTEIRGQLRFWWRLLAQQYQNQENNEIWKFSDGNDLPKQEFALWGGMSDGEEGGKASLVFLRVQIADKKLSKGKEQNVLNCIGYTEYIESMKGSTNNEKKIKAALSYILFTAQSNNQQSEMKLGQKGFEWTLQWSLNRHARCYNFDYDEKQKKWVKVPFKQKQYDRDWQQIHETLRWFVTLGGLGGRTRRGCGAFSAEGVKLVSKQEMEKLGCKILFSGSLKNVESAWIDAITEWKEIRKGELKPDFKAIEQQNNRHLATVFSKPVKDNGGQWRGMIIVLPNSSAEIQKMFGGKA